MIEMINGKLPKGLLVTLVLGTSISLSGCGLWEAKYQAQLCAERGDCVDRPGGESGQ